MRKKSVLFYFKPNLLSNSRLGISASKKFGNAVKRNLFKRIVREEFRHSKLKNLNFDILVVSNNRYSSQKEKLIPLNLEQFRSDIKSAFLKISLDQ